MLVKFSYSASRRICARRPRRSKNGTPEERAAAQAAETATTEPASNADRRTAHPSSERRRLPPVLSSNFRAVLPRLW